MKKGDKVYINLDYCAQLQDAIDFVEWFEFCKKNENIPIEIDTGENGEIYIGGAGVAANLLGSIENWLRSHGCREVTLDTTMPLKAAIKFYEKNGYHRSGTISDFFGMPLIEYVKRLS